MSDATNAPARRPISRRAWILGGVLLVGVVVVGLGLKFWYSPLGPALETGPEVHDLVATSVAQGTPQATAIAAVNATSAAPAATGGVAVIHTPAPTATLPAAGSNAQGRCSGPPLMNVLVLGTDTRTLDYTSGRADFIRAMRLDFHNETVRMLSIPRDLWVPIPRLAEHGVYESRLDEAYEYGNYFELPGGGNSLMADTLNLNLGLTFDHYIVVNFAAAEAGIDAIGGLDINLPEDIDGTHQGFPYFKAGPNHMDGKTLVQYVRIRYIDSDLYRMDRQNQVLLALREKLLKPGLMPALPELVSAMTKLIDTDLSPAQLSEIICLGRRVGLDQFDALKIGGPEVFPITARDGRLALLPNFEAIELVLKVFLAEGGSTG